MPSIMELPSQLPPEDKKEKINNSWDVTRQKELLVEVLAYLQNELSIDAESYSAQVVDLKSKETLSVGSGKTVKERIGGLYRRFVEAGSGKQEAGFDALVDYLKTIKETAQTADDKRFCKDLESKIANLREAIKNLYLERRVDKQVDREMKVFQVNYKLVVDLVQKKLDDLNVLTG